MADSAMATRTENLTGKLSVDTTAWRSGLLQASTMFKGFAGGIGRGLSSAFSGAFGAIKGTVSKIGGLISSTIGGALQALGIGGLLSTGGILAGIKNVADLGGEISDVSARTGIAADQLVILREQFRQGGIEAGSVTQYIRRMNDALLDSKKQNLFKALGLDSDRLLAQGPVESLNAIIASLRTLDSVATQQGVLSEIFGGRQGVQLMTLVVDEGSATKAKQMIGGMADIMKRSADDFDTISDNLFGGIPIKIQQAFAGFAEKMLKPLLAISDWVTKADFSPIGARIGDQIEYLRLLWSQMWTDGTLINFFTKSLLNGMMMAASFTAAVFGEAFKAAFSPANIQFAKTILLGLITWLGGAMQEIVGEIMQSLPFLGIQGTKAKSEGALKKEAGMIALDNGLRALPDGFSDATTKFIDGIQNWDVLSILKPASDVIAADLEALAVNAAKKAGISSLSPFAQQGGVIAALTPTMQPGTETSIFNQSPEGKARSANEKQIIEILKEGNAISKETNDALADMAFE